MEDYNNLIELSNEIQYILNDKNNNTYNELIIDRVIHTLLYYDACICFDTTCDIYSYCSEKNIQQLYQLQLVFKQNMLMVETNSDKYSDKYYYTILESFLRLSNLITEYLDNFYKYQINNINIIIKKIKYLKII